MLLIGFGMDLVMSPLQTAAREPFFFSRYFAIPLVIFLLLRLIWTSRYYLTNQRVIALSGPRWAKPTLHEMPVAGCRTKWFNRFGLTVQSPQNGTLRLAYLGMTDANSFAYDINRLGQANLTIPTFMTRSSPP